MEMPRLARSRDASTLECAAIVAMTRLQRYMTT
jgi:hypothetical protein